ncbi:nitrous oxide reductase family maturation protein NosD [Alcaligenaceae bacterium CGII-47]|nr:nitrous oxide reductase family maturation protein NosD [Alcaligenaceae bacterium CGII-47]
MSTFSSSIRRQWLAFSILLYVLGASDIACAVSRDVAAGEDLQQVIAAAAPGDELRLVSGRYKGNIVIDKPLILRGPADRSAFIIGARKGRSVSIEAPNVTLSHLTVKNSGLSLSEMDAGIFLDKKANGAVIENNDVLDNSVGVYVWGPHNATVQNNRIVGNTELRVAERGNGVTLWNSPGSRIIGNDISHGRDGIFSNTSKGNVFRANRFSHLRYAVHYMYTNDSEISENISEGNNIAYAIMFSERLIIQDNIALDSRDQGLMLNYANHSKISGNVIKGAEKCVFIYNANRNQIRSNHFEDCDIGIHFTAGAEGNQIVDNAFVSNRNQVKYVGTRHLDWSSNGRGNYWSDNTAFDLDGDGIADTAYRPNDIIDQVLWRAPTARLLLNSPAVSIIRWAQSQFPALLPGGVIDSAPIMSLPEARALKNFKNLP